ncbi:MAG: galactokinase family protein, partial [Clostridia bacterium]|nr:galactokinase family protein [Clostridia bacterium]
MNINEIKSAVLDGKFDDSFRLLYGETELPRKRYAAACDSFKALYPESGEIRFFSAPGRTEVGGNHTDHQHGCVLAASVNLDVIAVVSENNDGVIRIKSEGYPEDCVDI